MTMTTTKYAFRIEMDVPYEEAIEQATDALKTEGFGVLTRIDVKDTLKQKLDADFRRYVILGACNPHLAYQALQEELEVGLLLPCNVIVYEMDGGRSVVAITDPFSMLGVVHNPNLNEMAEEAQARLQHVAQKLDES